MPPALRTETGLPDPDGFYEALMQAHRDLDPAASRRLDARLVILLANHIGDAEVLREALALAQEAELAEPPADGRPESQCRQGSATGPER